MMRESRQYELHDTHQPKLAHLLPVGLVVGNMSEQSLGEILPNKDMHTKLNCGEGKLIVNRHIEYLVHKQIAACSGGCYHHTVLQCLHQDCEMVN